MTRKKMEAEIKPVVTKIVDDKILSALLGDMEDDTDKKTWLRHLHKGLIEDRTIEIELPAAQQGGGGPDFGRPGAAGGDMDFGQERGIFEKGLLGVKLGAVVCKTTGFCECDAPWGAP